MTCRDFAEFLYSYLAGELPSETLGRFERHLSVCPNCRRYLAQYRDAMAFGRTAFGVTDTMSDDVPEDLVAAVLAARSSS